MTDLVTSLRALAKAQHDDLSIALDAANELEKLRSAKNYPMRVFIIMEPDRGEGPMIGPVFASLEAAQAFLKSPEGRYRCYLYSEDGENVEGRY